jgi:signal transduction histidine kinase
MEGTSISSWMHTPNYGRAINSRAARYSARYYRTIIAILVSLLLLLEAMHTNQTLAILAVVGVLIYGIYLIARLRMPTEWTSRYYTPRLQFLRAQAGIVSLTLLLTAYAFFHQPNSLWVLYLLATMIVSEHCHTSTLLFTLGEIGFLLVVLGYIHSGLPLLAYLHISPEFVTASLHALAILLLGFLVHYLVRNVEARDTTIARYRQILDTLTANVRSLHDPQDARALVLETFRTMHRANCASIWTLDPQADRVRFAVCAEGQENVDCPATQDPLQDFSLPLDDDRLPACVARTGRPHFASKANRPPRQLAGALPAPRPFIPHARLELGIPIPDFQPNQPASLAVLCMAFDRPMSHEQMRQKHHAIYEMVHYLTPFLYYASLLEQYQALQQLAQTVTQSLDHDRVLDTLLELVVNVFGFDFATVSLVDEVHGVIRTVRGKNVPDEWIDMAVHPLDSTDIQADVIRTGRTEILTGWDERFDQKIWERFGHQNTVRVFVPVAVADPVTGSKKKRIGTLEAGYCKREREHITIEQVNLLRPFVDQAAVAVANARLYSQMRSKAEALTALHHGGQAIQSAVWRSKQLLEEIGHRAQQVLGADIVFLFEYDESSHRAEPMFVGGDVWGKGEVSPRLDEGNILDTIIREREPLYFPDAQHELRLVGYGGADGRQRRTFTQRQKVASFAGIPLLSGEELRGIMCVNYRAQHCFAEDERQLIELFAQQATIALENARLREKERKLIVAQQRDAFSRELHHSVSHDLFAIALKARTALHHIDSHDDQVTRELHHILDIAEKANRQVGYLISEFSALDLGGEDFRSVMRESVARIRQYYDIDVEIRCDEGNEANLSPRFHFALSRIVKEALNNAIRHSQCQRITISYTLCQQEISLEVTDDGIGFDLERALHKQDKFGIKNMQDYAQSLGCELNLQTAPGQGTCAAIRVPLHISPEGSLTCAPQTNPQ